MGQLIIDGDKIYEVDENCIKERNKKEVTAKEQTQQEIVRRTIPQGSKKGR